MKITSINIGGKLPQGLVELYADVSGHAKALDINYLVVGAMARDLVLVHGFGANIERGTRDVDFGINIASKGASLAFCKSRRQPVIPLPVILTSNKSSSYKFNT